MTIAAARVILESDPEAATRRTVEGWVSRTNRFYGDDEWLARREGATHLTCTRCTKPFEKNGYTVCRPCRIESDIERYNKREKRKWDGVALLYSDLLNEYLRDWDEVDRELDERALTLDDLRLIICEPVRPRIIEYGELVEDRLPDDDCSDNDGSTPDILKDIEALNEKLRAITLSWQPGKYAMDLTEHLPKTD